MVILVLHFSVSERPSQPGDLWILADQPKQSSSGSQGNLLNKGEPCIILDVDIFTFISHYNTQKV